MLYSNFNTPKFSSISFRATSQKINTSAPNVDKKDSIKQLDFSFNKKTGLLKPSSYVGKIADLNYNIEENVNLLQPTEYTGTIGNKNINLIFDTGFLKDKIKGSYENKPVDLLFSRDSLNGYKIEGVFNDKKVNLLLKENSNGYTLEGNDINLKINNNHFFGRNIEVKGKCSTDIEILPILMIIVNQKAEEDASMLAAAIAGGAIK